MKSDEEDSKQLVVEIIDQIDEAEKIWKELSPNKNIYDRWDFRHCFYKYFNYPLFFYTARVDGELIGLLPLQWNTEKELLEFFGGVFMEDNSVFIKEGYENCIPKLYSAIEKKAKLDDIVGEDEFTQRLDILENKYVANLENVGALSDYFSTRFSSKSRSNIKKKLKLVETLYQPKIVENNLDDLSRLFELNIKTFGGTSSFSKPFRKEIFKDLVKLDFNYCIITLIISGKKEAVSLAIKYGETYIYVNAGVNKEDYPNLGTYLIAKNFEKAISLGSKYFDGGCEDLGWKERWHLDKIPQRFFVKE